MWKKIYYSWAILVLFTLTGSNSVATAIAAPQEIIDQDNHRERNTGGVEVGTLAEPQRWQEFRPSINKLTAVEALLNVYSGGDPGNLTVQIRTQDGSQILASQTAAISGDGELWRKVSFATPIDLTPGDIYRLVLISEFHSGINTYDWYGAWPGSYACCISSEHSADSGNAFYEHDFYFRTYGFSTEIFTDNFEGRSRAAWSGSTGASSEAEADQIGALGVCVLCVNRAAALKGAYGLRVKVPDKAAHYLVDGSPQAETRYRARFYTNMKALKMTAKSKFRLFQGRMGTKKVFMLQVRKFRKKFWVRGLVRKDSRGYVKTAWVFLPKRTTSLEIDWVAASGPGALDGEFKLWLNGKLKRSSTGLDTDSLNVRSVRVGVTSPINSSASISGSFKLDAFESDNLEYLGAYVSPFPNPKGYEWKLAAGNLNTPLGIENAGDGSGRLFIIERAGLIRILRNGNVKEQPYLDIRGRVNSAGEGGLLGLAFHPDYPTSGYFYLNYTNVDNDTVISRFSVSGFPGKADYTSESILMTINQPYTNHNGGALAFGADEYLYIATGDGGSGGDPHGNGQALNTLLGKILRVDVDGAPLYDIPGDNPFSTGGGNGEIWAWGMRNPWRMSFDSQTGDVYIGDVGQGSWEEIDFLPARSPGGANFGWSYREGAHPFKGMPPPEAELIDPVAEYPNKDKWGCSVTGGVVYRGSNILLWDGVYFYGDFCSGRVWGLVRDSIGIWQTQELFKHPGRIVGFGMSEAGEVFLVDMSGGIYQLAKK